jgi:2'-5' RNA ligase
VGPSDVAQPVSVGVAVPIPEPWGAELRRWRASFGDPLAASIPTHVTLLPPTEHDASTLPAVEDHLAGVARSQRAFSMHLRGTATFRPVSPVVFVALSEGIGDCERVESAVRSGPLARELDFYYHPHVTVAHDLPEPVLDEAYEKLAAFETRFTVVGFSLYEHGRDGIWRTRRCFRFTQ